MNKHVVKEKPFEYLRHKNGDSYSAETINNWYVARAYVLEKLKDVAIGPTSNEHLHAVVKGDSPLMLSAVREVALLAHFANFDETSGSNCSVITLVSDNDNIVEELRKEEYLCNLLDHCKYSVYGSAPINADSYLDVELEVVRTLSAADKSGLVVEMSDNDVNEFLKTSNLENIKSIDTRKAVYVGRIYELGVLIDNLPAEDIHSPRRYMMALDTFEHVFLQKPMTPLINPEKWSSNLIQAKNGISSICCADCFELRARGMNQCCKNVKKDSNKAWEDHIEVLSISEHARWVTERLIMGVRFYTKEERIRDERSFGGAKKQYRNRMKKNASDPVSVDICSFAELRRTNPGDMKYDSFLMLAIPKILEKIRQEDKM